MLALLVHLPLPLLFCLWACRTYLLTRGPAGALGALALLIPAGLILWSGLGILRARRAPWGWTTKALLTADILLPAALLILLPRAGRTYHASQEERTRREAGSMRAAIAAWRKDTGSPPDRPSELVPHYLSVLPRIALPGTPHPVTREVEFVQAAGGVDTGKWLYVNNPGNPFYGNIRINCTHTDSHGTSWAAY